MSGSLIQQLEAELGAINRQIAVLEERRGGIEKVLATYEPGQHKAEDGSRDLSTIEMARQVVEQNGVPMGPSDIRRAIQRRFGVVPASSLQQMLYIRASNKKIFFNEDKKYGLLAWRKK